MAYIITEGVGGDPNHYPSDNPNPNPKRDSRDLGPYIYYVITEGGPK